MFESFAELLSRFSELRDREVLSSEEEHEFRGLRHVLGDKLPWESGSKRVMGMRVPCRLAVDGKIPAGVIRFASSVGMVVATDEDLQGEGILTIGVGEDEVDFPIRVVWHDPNGHPFIGIVLDADNVEPTEFIPLSPMFDTVPEILLS